MRDRPATKYHVGTSGWHYDHWRGRFYPMGLPKRGWLDFYAGHFSTVELNNSFYNLPSEKAFASWRDSSPEDFTFSVKVSRFITHLKKLRNVEESLRNFLDRVRILGYALGPLLYQLPPNLHRDDSRLEAFLSTLPGDVSHVFEFRHESWFQDDVFRLLRRHNVGFCAFDMPDMECPLLATASFAYVRFHGSEAIYASNYTPEMLDGWAERLRRLAEGLSDVYVYFNNDAFAYAVYNATTLAELLAAPMGLVQE